MPKIRVRVSVGDLAIEDISAFLEDLPFPDAETIEANTGLYFEDWRNKIDEGSATARRALAWLVLRQANPRMTISQVNVGVGKLKTQGLAHCPVCASDEPIGTRPVDKTKPDGERELFCFTCRTVYDDDTKDEGAPARPTPTEAGDAPPSENDESPTAP